jgi:hypothetical protein
VVSKKTAAWWGVMGFLFLVWIVGLNIRWSSSPARQIAPVAYNARRICDEALEHDIDYSKSEETHFEVTLHEYCWSGIVSVPSWWMRNMDGFNVQSSGDQKGFWVAYWFTAFNHPTNIYGPNHAAFFQNQGSSFRLQGHGKLNIFTHHAPMPKNDSQPKGSGAAPTAPPLSALQVYPGDAHSCDKPDDVAYGNHQWEYPKFLFDIHNNGFSNSDTQINWAGGFRGKVPVCFIVDEKGNPTAVHPIQPLNKPELERRINEVVSGWRYQAGIINDPQTLDERRRRVPPTSHPAKTQMLTYFDFH